MQCRPLLEQAQVLRAGTGQDLEGLRLCNHGHLRRSCAGMGHWQGGVGLLGPQDTLPGAGGPQLPHVLPLALRLEQARDQEMY